MPKAKEKTCPYCFKPFSKRWIQRHISGCSNNKERHASTLDAMDLSFLDDDGSMHGEILQEQDISNDDCLPETEDPLNDNRPEEYSDPDDDIYEDFFGRF